MFIAILLMITCILFYAILFYIILCYKEYFLLQGSYGRGLNDPGTGEGPRFGPRVSPGFEPNLILFDLEEFLSYTWSRFGPLRCKAYTWSGKRHCLALGFKRTCLRLSIRNCDLQSSNVSCKDPSMMSPELEITAEFKLEKRAWFWPLLKGQ